jgi:hypothetical protein
MTNILMMKDIAEARELASKAGIAQLTAEYAGDMGDSEEMDAEMGVESPFFIDGLPATAAESGKAEREARALLAEMEDGNATS